MEKKNLTAYESLIAGVVAGSCSTASLMPILTYKFCKQNNTKLPSKFINWFRGVHVQVSNIAPITAFQITTNNILIQNLSSDHDLSNFYKINIAFLSGGISALLYTPSDFVTIQLQKKKYKISNIYKTFGIKPFFSGLFPCIIRESCYTGSYLGIAPVLTRKIQDYYKLDYITSNICGSLLTSAVVTTFSQPFDTIKTMTQSDFKNKDKTFTKMYNVTKKHGVMTLYKGYVPRIIWMCGAILINMHIISFFENNKN